MEPDQIPNAIIGGIDRTAIVAGSQCYCCFNCHRDTWIAPASIRVLTQHPGIKILCLTCYITDPTIPATTETAANRDEVVACVGSEELADILIANGKKHLAELKRKAARLEPWRKN